MAQWETAEGDTETQGPSQAERKRLGGKSGAEKARARAREQFGDEAVREQAEKPGSTLGRLRRKREQGQLEGIRKGEKPKGKMGLSPDTKSLLIIEVLKRKGLKEPEENKPKTRKKRMKRSLDKIKAMMDAKKQ